MFKSILVAVDVQEPSSWKKSLPTAIALSKSSGASLTIATIVPDFQAMIEAEWSEIGYRQMVELAHVRLGALTDEFPEAASARLEVGSGNVWRGVMDIAKEVHADLIVLASHRPAMKDYLIGANAVNVVRHAPCSVMVVRD